MALIDDPVVQESAVATDSAPEPTPASAWRDAEHARLVHLPTDRWARVRRVNLLTLLEYGVLPVWDEDMLKDARAGRVMDVIRRFHRPDLYVQFIKVVLAAGCVEPKVTSLRPEEAAEDEVSVDLLSASEQTALLNAISALSGFSPALAKLSAPFGVPEASPASESSTPSPTDTGDGPLSS